MAESDRKSVSYSEIEEKKETISLLDKTIEEKDRKIVKLTTDLEMINS